MHNNAVTSANTKILYIIVFNYSYRLIQVEQSFKFFEEIEHHRNDHCQYDNKPCNRYKRCYIVSVGFFQYLTYDGNEYTDCRNLEYNIDAHN